MHEEAVIRFPGGKKITAQLGSRVVETDQPVEKGGEGSAASPFELFLASIGTCAGIYILSFCEKRGIPTDRLRIVQRHTFATTGPVLEKVSMEIEVPPDFPAEHRDALVQVAGRCAVKRSLAADPEFVMEVREVDGA